SAHEPMPECRACLFVSNQIEHASRAFCSPAMGLETSMASAFGAATRNTEVAPKHPPHRAYRTPNCCAELPSKSRVARTPIHNSKQPAHIICRKLYLARPQ